MNTMSAVALSSSLEEEEEEECFGEVWPPRTPVISYVYLGEDDDLNRWVVAEGETP